MLKDYPKFRKGEVEEVYNKLSDTEKKHFKEYLTYRKARGLNSDDKVNDVRRYLLHLRYIYERDLRKLNLKEFRELLAIINSSELSSNSKNHIKTDLRNFLIYSIPTAHSKFSNFEDIKFSNSKNEERINSKTIFTKEEIDKLIKHEKKLFWKTFILVQYEGGLRTIEARTLKWDNINFNLSDNVSEISVYSTKTKKSRTIFINEATNYLKQLKEEQENTKEKGIYVFHSKNNKDLPVNKNAVSMWFRRLTKKVINRQGWCYLLRHSRATELYKLAKENKISEDTAVKFMGHSKSMSSTYTHLDKEDIKKMLIEQVYKIEELTPQEKNSLKELQEEVNLLKQKVGGYEQMFKIIEEKLTKKGILAKS